jgi:hypothetical protein
MSKDISEAEAQLALRAIEDQQRHVLAEVGLPRWYWWGLAAAWVAIGLLADLDNPWVTGSATLVFGAAHSAIAQRIFSGRRRSGQLSVRAGLVDRHLPSVLFACLIALGFVTVGLGFAANADGADHAGTVASIVVAVAILGFGPRVVAAVRRRAEQNVGA